MTTTEIILLIFALAFVVLVIFLARFLYVATKTVRRLNRTISGVNLITFDAQQKLKTLNPLFHSLSNLGKTLQKKTNVTYEQFNEDKPHITAVCDLITLGAGLWKKMQNKWSKNYER